MSINRRAAIVGSAQLPFSKNVGTPERTNALRVTQMALEDAGIVTSGVPTSAFVVGA
jgi:hypothetical protein